jgi:hypothetical protein
MDGIHRLSGDVTAAGEDTGAGEFGTRFAARKMH